MSHHFFLFKLLVVLGEVYEDRRYCDSSSSIVSDPLGFQLTLFIVLIVPLLDCKDTPPAR